MQTPRRSAATALAGLVTVTGLAVADAPRDHVPDPGAQRAVTALLTGSSSQALAAVPDTFEDHLGYVPRAQDGSVVDPSGSCSSPVPLPTSFETACRQHDYGYDLLRHADLEGGPLPAAARAALDDQLAREAARSCTVGPTDQRARCRRWAGIAATFVRANSVRQHHSVPDPEDIVSVATAGAGLAVLAGGATFLLRCARRIVGARVRGAGAREVTS